MAGKTRNTVMVQARKRADELAAKRREREEHLKELATEYLAETITAVQLVKDAEVAAAALVSTAKAKAEVGRERAKVTVARMLATGETRSGVAELLDVSVSFVRGIDLATGKAAAKPEIGDAGAATEGSPSEQSGGVGVVA